MISTKRPDGEQREVDVVITSTPPPLNAPQQEDLFFTKTTGVVPTSNVDSSITALRRFFDFLSQQLPLATAATDSLIVGHQVASAVASAAGNEQRLLELSNVMMDSEAKERRFVDRLCHLSMFFVYRFQSELLKMTAELSQLTALNNTLSRKYQTSQQDLLTAQSSAQSFREDAARLVREISILREELLLLRERSQVLEAELRATGRLSTDLTAAALGSITGSPAGQASVVPSGVRRPLHHVKNNSGTNHIAGSPNLSDQALRLDPHQLRGAPSSAPNNVWKDIRSTPLSGSQYLVTQVYVRQ